MPSELIGLYYDAIVYGNIPIKLAYSIFRVNRKNRGLVQREEQSINAMGTGSLIEKRSMRRVTRWVPWC
jgi:hypothetical protein